MKSKQEPTQLKHEVKRSAEGRDQRLIHVEHEARQQREAEKRK